jgi:hypothetical protein
MTEGLLSELVFQCWRHGTVGDWRPGRIELHHLGHVVRSLVGVIKAHKEAQFTHNADASELKKYVPMV